MVKKSGSIEQNPEEQSSDLPEGDQLDQDLDNLQKIKGGDAPGLAGEQVKPGALPRQEDLSLWVMEARDEANEGIFHGALWENYKYQPGAPSMVGRKYKDIEDLAADWVGSGVRLMLIRGSKLVMALGSLTDIDRQGRTAELRYLLDRMAVGKGLQRKAIQYFSRWANEHIGIDRLYIKVFKDDKTTREILEKAGWKKCGVLPGYGVRNGVVVDVVIMTAADETLLKYYEDEAEGAGEPDGRRNQNPAGSDTGSDEAEPGI